MMNSGITGWHLSACYRAEWLALAVFHMDILVEVRRHRITTEERNPQGLATLIENFALDYSVERVIVEPGSTVYTATRTLPLSIYPLTIAEVKQTLLSIQKGSSHQALYDQLVHDYPSLRRLVTILRSSGQVAISESWRTVVLLAVALGLAYAKTVPSQSALATTSFSTFSNSYVPST